MTASRRPAPMKIFTIHLPNGKTDLVSGPAKATPQTVSVAYYHKTGIQPVKVTQQRWDD
jgi:hypothetical protein